MASSSACEKKPVRISDCLLRGDDDSDGAAAELAVVVPGTPPRLRIPGFTCARIRFVRFGRSKGRKELAVAAEKSEAASSAAEADDASGREAGSGSGASSSAAAATTEAAAGLGLSLLFLLARTSVELNKMGEVRAQMEALLGEMRDEAARCKRHITAAARRHLRPASSSTSSTPASGYSTDTTGGDGRSTSSPAMATANCETEKQVQEEEEGWSDGEFIELEGGFGTGAGLSLRRGINVHDDEEDGAVSGVELERRLHELQHERDRERVAELEAALRRAERRVVEKEMEARLWKDTAELALQRPPPPLAVRR
ncbi:protein POLAR-like 1 [Oryza brachyantha]|uniref:protein POLAR-like 1 n=1 Tax=Oryza brachyantha TaxID=4533 RepID=UPI001ADA4031|nr:protein POLAR-like 1 [Oryza brachyantha]